MTGYIQVVTTCGSKTEAENIAKLLVEERLCACAQISGPITSTFRWESRIEQDEEWYCIVKTSEVLYDQVEEAICRLHSYEVPEILAVPIVSGNPAYLAWMKEELAEK